MNLIAKEFNEVERKERGIERLERARQAMKDGVHENLARLDRLIIREKLLMKKDTKLENKIERMKFIQDKDLERSILRSCMFEHEDFLDKLCDERLKSIR